MAFTMVPPLPSSADLPLIRRAAARDRHRCGDESRTRNEALPCNDNSGNSAAGIQGNVVSFSTIFLGVIPFALTDIARPVVLIGFPRIALWLPGRTRGLLPAARTPT